MVPQLPLKSQRSKVNGVWGIRPPTAFGYNTLHFHFSSVQSLGLNQLCDPMDCSTPGFPVHHQLSEPIQTHVHRVSDVIQPSHPLLSPSPPALNISQHQGFFK